MDKTEKFSVIPASPTEVTKFPQKQQTSLGDLTAIDAYHAHVLGPLDMKVGGVSYVQKTKDSPSEEGQD